MLQGPIESNLVTAFVIRKYALILNNQNCCIENKF